MIRYFPAATTACPTYVEDTEWTPLVDGVSYFRELSEVLSKAGPGDTVSIAGLELDPDLDLDGRTADDPEHRPLGLRLARLAADGVDVRVLLACRVLAASIPGPLLGGFRTTALNAETLRGYRVDGAEQPPLSGRVILDHSGPLLGANHQKVVVAHVGGELSAFVGGIDLVTNRADQTPHDTLRRGQARWGWHDLAVRLRGAAAGRVWEILAARWAEATTLPRKRYLRRPLELVPLNRDVPVGPPAAAPTSPTVNSRQLAVRVLRSSSGRKIDSLLPSRRTAPVTEPASGIHEVFHTVVTALAAAQRYVYLEDQYLQESPGGNSAFELYPHLRAAARRGVKVVLVGSGTRDPEDPGVHVREINRTVNRHLRRKIVDKLDEAHRDNVAVFRIERVTVHAKLVLVDDAFACIGSANMFSRSMAGTDRELSTAVATTTSLVRDLRVEVWADHLRAPLTPELRSALEDLDVSLGIWRPAWAAAPDPSAWRTAGHPRGYEPRERALRLIESGPR